MIHDDGGNAQQKMPHICFVISVVVLIELCGMACEWELTSIALLEQGAIIVTCCCSCNAYMELPVIVCFCTMLSLEIQILDFQYQVSHLESFSCSAISGFFNSLHSFFLLQCSTPSPSCCCHVVLPALPLNTHTGPIPAHSDICSHQPGQQMADSRLRNLMKNSCHP